MTSRVLIADFQYLTRQSISALVQSVPQFELCGVVEEKERILENAVLEQPDIVIIDISDTQNELINAIQEIRESVRTSFLVISNNQSKEAIQKLLGIGVKCILTKNCSEEEITNGLKAVAKGNRFFCNNVLDMVMHTPTEKDDCEPTQLSKREYEVLEWITKGKTTADIADTLSISVHTVNTHRKNILKKLNLKSPAELIVYALETGLARGE